MSTTGFTDTDVKVRTKNKQKTEGPRRQRQIYNRVKYRLNKRRNLWLRSIAAAKSPEKIKILQAKIEAVDFALATLEDA